MANCNETYSYSKFKMYIFNDIKKTYEKSIINEEVLIINHDCYEISILLKDSYESYCFLGDYRIYFEHLLTNIEEHINKHKFRLNPDRIYPMIKSKDFGKNETFPFIRDNLFLDLDVLYVQDMGEMYRYISDNDILENEGIRLSAYNNLKKISNTLIEIDMDIYMYKFESDFNSSMILKEDEMKRIINKVGNKFLMAIPNGITLILAADYLNNYSVISRLIREEEYKNKISDKIYRCINGIWTYADTQPIMINADI